MPAMPKEKSPVSISENPYSEIINMTAVSTTYLGTPKVPTELLNSITSATVAANTGSISSSPVATNDPTVMSESQFRHGFLSKKKDFPRRRCPVSSRSSSARSSTVDCPSSSSASSSFSNTSSTPTLASVDSSISTTPMAAPDQKESDPSSTGTPPKTTPTTTVTGRPNQTVIKKTANDFIFGKYIGEGSYSTVYLAKDVHTSKEYAIKVCDKQHIIRERKQEYIRREREVMHIMNNVPGFVNLSCTFQDSRNLYFVMTYAKNSDLLPYINRVGSFDLECTCHYAAELVLAVEQMHKRGIVHRDLKPENILLDENMHTLIADFGSAKILTAEKTDLSSSCSTSTEDSPAAASYSNGGTTGNMPPRRRGSFVGTAQYVSPEVLQGKETTKAADLWALGCIIYQMIAGLPPFRGSSDYLIFREIMNLNLVFPEGFDKNAEDLVRKLLKLDPEERIGAQDKDGRYESIRTHPFFEKINWDTIRREKPPRINPYLPGVHEEEELRSNYFVPHNLEPGLDDRQLSRLLGLELGTAVTPSIEKTKQKEKKTESKNKLNLSEAEKERRLELQRIDKWSQFCDGEVILKKGFVNKRKGLFARKRMLLLTTGPRLIYVDPVQMVKKGEIPWSADLRVEPKNFKIFFVHTPNRTYYLEDPEGYALEWGTEIENVRQKIYGGDSEPSTASQNEHTN